MKRKLIISSIVGFPVLVVSQKYILDRDWQRSLFAASIWEIIYLLGMFLFIKWWMRKAEQQKHT